MAMAFACLAIEVAAAGVEPAPVGDFVVVRIRDRRDLQAGGVAPARISCIGERRNGHELHQNESAHGVSLDAAPFSGSADYQLRFRTVRLWRACRPGVSSDRRRITSCHPTPPRLRTKSWARPLRPRVALQSDQDEVSVLHAEESAVAQVMEALAALECRIQSMLSAFVHLHKTAQGHCRAQLGP